MANNVLLITVDQLPASMMAFMGDHTMLSPTLNSLARDGVVFASHYSTCPVCIPARRSLMTGLFPSSHGDRVYSDRMPMPKVTTLAEAFRMGGYQTYAVGKLHVYPQRNRIGFDDVILSEEGRDEFGTVDDYEQYLATIGHAGEDSMHAMGQNTYYTRPWHLEEACHPTAWATREMCRTIIRKDPTRPAFWYLSYCAPHPPLVPPRDYLALYDDVEIPEPLKGDWEDNLAVMPFFQEMAMEYSNRDIALAKKAFYAQCTFIDHQIRLVIGTLKERELLDNTIIAFTSDHGDSLFDHGMVGKRNFSEGSAHVPCIIGGKPLANKRGQVKTSITCLEDMMPTLLNLCGLPIPETVEVEDMFSSNRDYLYGEISEGVMATRMVRGKDLKLVYYPAGNSFVLFDITHDPEELHDLYPEHKQNKEVLSMIAYLISQLHGDDLSWLEDGVLKGFPVPPFQTSPQYSLRNQRGYHLPPALRDLK